MRRRPTSMYVCVVLASLTAFACGRFGFESNPRDASVDGRADAASDASVPDPVAYCTKERVAPTHFVSTSGSDAADGVAAPWRTLGGALQMAPPGAVIEVAPGEYSEAITFNRQLDQPITLRSEVPYAARIVSTNQAIACFTGCAGLTVEGFEITQSASGGGPLIHVSDTGRGLTVRNCVIHDTADNAIVRVSGGGSDFVLEFNVIYNNASSGMIHLAASTNAIVRHNVVFHDYAAPPPDQPFAMIWLENNNGPSVGHQVAGNVLMRWGGSAGGSMVRIDNAIDIELSSNLLVGDGDDPMAAAFNIRGATDISIDSNTITGDLPGEAFAMVLGQSGSGSNSAVRFTNNIFSDPTGTMNDFADGTPAQAGDVTIANNLYFNGGNPILGEAADAITVASDSSAIELDPQLPYSIADAPRFDGSTFGGMHNSFCTLFADLVGRYGQIPQGSPAIGMAFDTRAQRDVLGRRRTTATVGAAEPP